MHRLLSLVMLRLLQIPPIQNTHTDINIRSKPQPATVRHQQPSADPTSIQLERIHRQRHHRRIQRQDIRQRQRGLRYAEEERHPGEVERQLEGVERGCGGAEGGVQDDGGVRGEAVDGVAHQAVEGRPDGAEDPAGRTKRGLSEGCVGFLGFGWSLRVADCCAERDWEEDGEGCV